MISRLLSQIPYVMEQGISRKEQGIFCVDQGMSGCLQSSMALLWVLRQPGMSAIPPKAGIDQITFHVR
jgi:hypothetical protein